MRIKEPNMTSTLIIEDRRLLVVHNVKHGGLRIEAPGGKKEGGEDLGTCRDRELEEELGIIVGNCTYFGDYETRTPEGLFLVRMEIATITKGIPEIQDKERCKLRGPYWRTYEELTSRWKSGLVHNLRLAIDDLRKGGYF